jgi:hypothetical protein
VSAERAAAVVHLSDHAHHEIPAGVVPGTTVLALPETLTFDEWAELGLQLRAALNSTAWWVGDWLVYAHERWTTPEDRGAVYQRLADLGFDGETVERYRRVCALFPPTLRHEALSWSHHAVVAALDLEEACELLITAHDQGWSCRRLREAVRATRAIDVPSTEVSQPVRGIAVHFKGSEVPPVVAERLARAIEKALAQVGVAGDVKVR